MEKVVNYFFPDSDSLFFMSNLNKTVEPKNFNDSCSYFNWLSIVNDEMDTLYRNNTCYITNIHVCQKPIGCKWI